MNILLFYNPLSKIKKLSTVKELLGRGNNLTLSGTTKPNDLQYISRQIKEGGHDIIVSAGGDGFLSEVINGMLLSGTSLPVGIIPAGSMNVFALSAGIPGNIAGACRTILNKNKVKVDLGRIDNGSGTRYFICWAGIGFDVHVIRLVNKYSFIKRNLGGMMAHLLMGIFGLFTYSPGKCSVKTGDIICEGCNLIVSNISSYASKNTKLAENAEINDGYLHIRLLKGGKKTDIIRYLAGLTLGNYEGFSDVTSLKSRKMEITSEYKLPIHADAEEIGMKLPVKIEIMPETVEIILP